MALGGRQDLLSSPFLGGFALEVGLIEARDGVANVRLVVDREVLAAVAVDVGELVLAQRIPLLRAQIGYVAGSYLRERNPPVAYRVPNRS
jgi:hypothetical protein